MAETKYKYVYGPVPSWRLGSSLGVDPISQKKKVCSFDCVYCQLGKTRFLSSERKMFIPTDKIIEEISSLPPVKIDYITFSGTGEPTLAENLGQMIKAVKKIRREKIAVLTNSSLLGREDVMKDLFLADFVVAKLDASREEVFESVNHPVKTVKMKAVVEAIKNFRACYIGKLALQVMFIEQNQKYAKEIAEIAKEINPDEVQINTPLRPCDIAPLSKADIEAIEGYFAGLNAVSVYKTEKKNVKPISSKETLRRRGKV